ncbi:MAG: phosphoheptose isomerase [Bacteroidetes bacterium HGW-Bacteroidetes-21]|jgi:D-sedoheptulose 7-phosphate isomerase|nr:MAG: phosphoheptose isomerase [Bacteroidetes bacterium HGW-Bacteroidetes-21]
MNQIAEILKASAELKMRLAENPDMLKKIKDAAELIIQAFKQGKKVLFCGNGGSAADAQHLAAELSGRFEKDRPPLYAEALHVNTSYTTAVTNDYSFDIIYSRLIEAMGNEGDILIGFSTSGNSVNVNKAMEKAHSKKMKTIAFTGKDGGHIKDLADISLIIPHSNTARIQEAHITIGHIICKIVEEKLFG